jgi:hypothetical protein
MSSPLSFVPDESAVPAPKARQGIAPLGGAAVSFRSPAWLMRFVYVEMACQVALLLPSVAGARVFIRTAAFAGSVLLVLFLRGPREEHPAKRVALFALGIVGLSIFHPTTNTILAGIATLAFNIAILGPIFWVPRIRIDLKTLRHLFFVFWVFQTASASLGVLQVYFPGRFQPAAASVLTETYVQGLQITLQSGVQVLRPMGLTDTPGGAGMGGVYAVLLACGFLLDRPRMPFRIALLGSICVGCFTVYICQVRALFVMLVVSLIAMLAPFVLQGRMSRLMKVGLPVAAVGLASLGLALAIGADAVTGRLSTLFDDSFGNVYYSNRGLFLEHTFTNLLPEYPFGAGLGRCGMMRAYFGDEYNASSPPIWAEIQWTVWLLDGGVPLMLLYSSAIVMTIREALRTAMRLGPGHEDIGKWAAVLAGYSVGVLACTFGWCPFAGTVGVDFWVLNAALFAASRQLRLSHQGDVGAVANVVRGKVSRGGA